MNRLPSELEDVMTYRDFIELRASFALDDKDFMSEMEFQNTKDAILRARKVDG